MKTLQETKLNDKDAAGNAQAFPMTVERPYLDDSGNRNWEYCTIDIGVVGGEDDYGRVCLSGILPAVLAQRVANVPLLEAEVEDQADRIVVLERELAELRQQYQIQQEAAENSHGVAINHQRTAMEAMRHAAEMRAELDRVKKVDESDLPRRELLERYLKLYVNSFNDLFTTSTKLLMELRKRRAPNLTVQERMEELEKLMETTDLGIQEIEK